MVIINVNYYNKMYMHKKKKIIIEVEMQLEAVTETEM